MSLNPQKPLSEIVANRVTSLMKLNKVTQSQLIGMANITTTELSHLINPSVRRSASLSVVERVACAFNVSPDAILVTNHVAAIADRMRDQEAIHKDFQVENDQPAQGNQSIKAAFQSVGNALKSVTVPAVAFPETEVVMLFPVKGGKEWAFTGASLLEMQAAYPGLDCMRELRESRAWCLANPSQQKTPRGMMKFINSWFARAMRTQKPKPIEVQPKPAEPTKYGYFDIDGPKTPYKPKETVRVPDPDFTEADLPLDDDREQTEDIAVDPFADDEPIPADDGFQPDGADF